MHRSTGPVRLLRAAAFASVLAGSFAGQVSAKMPYFSVETSPTEPIAGEPIRIVVRFWADAGHTSAAPFEWEPTMDDLLVIRAESGAPEVGVFLQLRQPGRFEATVTLEAGDWTIVAFPDRTGWATPEVPEGYPDAIPIAVREPALDPWRVAGPLVVVAMVIVAGAFALLLWARRTPAGRDIQVTE